MSSDTGVPDPVSLRIRNKPTSHGHVSSQDSDDEHDPSTHLTSTSHATSTTSRYATSAPTQPSRVLLAALAMFLALAAYLTIDTKLNTIIQQTQHTLTHNSQPQMGGLTQQQQQQTTTGTQQQLQQQQQAQTACPVCASSVSVSGSVSGGVVPCGWWSGDELTRWFFAHKTGRTTWKWLHYFDFYEDNFGWVRSLYRCHKGQFKQNTHTQHTNTNTPPKRPLRMMEIGTRDGGSLEMWKYYFNLRLDDPIGAVDGPVSFRGDLSLFGMDINPHAVVYNDATSHTRMFIGSQSNVTFLNFVLSELGPGSIDIILDDASHLPTDQLASFQVLRHLMSENSIYMIEDIIHDHANSPLLTTIQGIADHLQAYEKGSAEQQQQQRQDAPSYAVKYYKNVVVLQKKQQEYITPNTRAVKMGDWVIPECNFAAC